MSTPGAVPAAAVPAGGDSRRWVILAVIGVLLFLSSCLPTAPQGTAVTSPRVLPPAPLTVALAALTAVAAVTLFTVRMPVGRVAGWGWRPRVAAGAGIVVASSTARPVPGPPAGPATAGAVVPEPAAGEGPFTAVRRWAAPHTPARTPARVRAGAGVTTGRMLPHREPALLPTPLPIARSVRAVAGGVGVVVRVGAARL